MTAVFAAAIRHGRSLRSCFMKLRSVPTNACQQNHSSTHSSTSDRQTSLEASNVVTGQKQALMLNDNAAMLQWTKVAPVSAWPPFGISTAQLRFAHLDLGGSQVRWKHGGGPTDFEGREDTILLKGLVFHGYHGVLEEERRLGQKFVVDIEASADLRRAGETDNLDDTVNYAAVYQDVKAIVEGQPRQLLESVAQSISDEILRKHPLVSRLTITLKKPHVAVEGTCEFLGVRVHRNRTADHRTSQTE